MTPAKESLKKAACLLSVPISLSIHCAKLFRCGCVAFLRAGRAVGAIRGPVMTENIPYLSLITWVSLTSIKEIERSPDGFAVGRWRSHSCSRMPGGGRALRWK